MGERWQVGYVICEIKGISQEGQAEGGSLDSKSCWGRDGWSTAAFAMVREKDSVKNQVKMMGVGLQVLTASRKDKKSGNLWQGTSLLLWGTSQEKDVNWKLETLLQTQRILYCWQEERKEDLGKLEEAGQRTRVSLSTMFVWCWICIHQSASRDSSLTVWLGFCSQPRRKSGRWTEGKGQDPLAENRAFPMTLLSFWE